LASRSGNTVCTQLSELSLRCTSSVSGEALALEGFRLENPMGQSPVSEGVEKLISPNGKWLDFNFRKRRQSLLVLEAPREVSVNGFAFRTAGDHPARDPVRLRVESSSSASEPPSSEAAVAGSVGRGRMKMGTLDRGSKASEGQLSRGGEWAVLFEGSVEAPAARKAWSDWLPLRKPCKKTDAIQPQSRPSGGAPLEDLLQVLLHVVPGRRIDVKARIDTVGELEVQELRLQPGETTAARTLNLRLRDGSLCEWRLWGGEAEKHDAALLGRHVVVRGARATKFSRGCSLHGGTGLEVCG